MKSSADWIKDIEELFELQKKGKIERGDAAQMNATLGNLIKLTAQQIRWMEVREKLNGKVVDIPQLMPPDKEK